MHNPDQPTITLPAFSVKALEALSNVIVTATEGGHYTREDYRKWTDYKHGDTLMASMVNGSLVTEKYFRAEVTVTPQKDALAEGIPAKPIRMTPEELGGRLFPRLLDPKMAAHHRALIARLLAGDEDAAGEADVIDSGALLQIAVYGEVIFG
jgi:hypothetical protein